MRTLSIVTVVLNDIDGIIRTYNSLSLINVSYEWIVVDGGSIDGTYEWIHKNIKQNHIVISESDNGIYDAMNKGWRIASGKWVYFLNAGDYLLENITEALFCCESVDVISGLVELVDKELSSMKKKHPSMSQRKKGLINSCCIAHQATFVRKDIFNDFGGYSCKYKIVSDYEYWVRLHVGGVVFRYIDNVIAGFVFDGISSKVENYLLAEHERANILLDYGMVSRKGFMVHMMKAYFSYLVMLMVRGVKKAVKVKI